MQKVSSDKEKIDLCSEKNWCFVMCVLKGISGCDVITAMSRVGVEVAGHLFGYFKASGLIFLYLCMGWGELNGFQLVWVINRVASWDVVHTL